MMRQFQELSLVNQIQTVKYFKEQEIMIFFKNPCKIGVKVHLYKCFDKYVEETLLKWRIYVKKAIYLKGLNCFTETYIFLESHIY